MLTIRDMGFSIGGTPLFIGASAQIPAGAHLGLVGRNGTGKTSLFRLILGEWTPDTGEISLPPRTRTGTVAQEAPGDDRTLIETVLAADAERAALIAEAELATDAHRIADIHTRLADIDAHSAEARAATILSGLGFDHAAQGRVSQEFSGGWRMRVALAAVLFAAPDLLLLDEPTNYLDLEGSVWLENYLARYPYTALVISHDRGLLNRAVNGILHLEGRRLTSYSGGYDTFDRVRRERLALASSMARKQEARRAHMQAFVDRFRYQANKARQAQSRLKMLARMEPIAAMVEGSVSEIHFPNPDELAPPLMQLDGVTVGYDGKPVLSRIGLRIDQDDRIALLGANGQGKSTLAKLIAGRLAPMTGARKVSSKLRIGFFNQHQAEELVAGETPIDHIRRRRPDETPGKLRARLAAGGTSSEIAETRVAHLSGGQKARLVLTLAALDAPHLMILDEPTNHLDIESREALVTALNDYRGAVILITHDAHLIELIADRLWLVSDGRVAPYDGDMAAYRRLLLGQAEPRPRKTKAAPVARPKRQLSRGETKALAPLRAVVRTCEERLERITGMLERVDFKLAEPALYNGPPGRIETLQKKRAEILDAQDRAEGLWMTAQEKLETAER
ncbi:MAG: ABC-F family ATP-binding cassette domain-containing protein [Alphaproteobacteria bacterium]